MDTLHSASDTVVESVTSAFFLALLFVLSHLCHHTIQSQGGRVAGTTLNKPIQSQFSLVLSSPLHVLKNV